MGYSPWGPKESNTTEQLILEGVIFELRPKEGFKKSSDGWVEGFLGRIESKSMTWILSHCSFLRGITDPSCDFKCVIVH